MICTTEEKLGLAKPAAIGADAERTKLGDELPAESYLLKLPELPRLASGVGGCTSRSAAAADSPIEPVLSVESYEASADVPVLPGRAFLILVSNVES